MATVLAVDGLSKAYGPVAALRDVTLTLCGGETLGIIGPNGAGKSTFARLIVGLESPDAGVIRHERLAEGQRRWSVGYAPQQTSVYPSLSVMENLEFFAALGSYNGAGPTGIDDLLHHLGLDGLAGKRVAHLSGGQQRLVHVAIAMLGRPEVLILDEPTIGADVIARSNLLSRLSNHVADGGALIYTSHYLSEFDKLANLRLAFLIEGSVRAVGSIDELVARLGRNYVELLFPGSDLSLSEPLAESVEFEVVSNQSRIRILESDPAVVRALVEQIIAEVGVPENLQTVHPALDEIYEVMLSGQEG